MAHYPVALSELSNQLIEKLYMIFSHLIVDQPQKTVTPVKHSESCQNIMPTNRSKIYQRVFF
jgi:hypothetical protein